MGPWHARTGRPFGHPRTGGRPPVVSASVRVARRPTAPPPQRCQPRTRYRPVCLSSLRRSPRERLSADAALQSRRSCTPLGRRTPDRPSPILQCGCTAATWPGCQPPRPRRPPAQWPVPIGGRRRCRSALRLRAPAAFASTECLLRLCISGK